MTSYIVPFSAAFISSLVLTPVTIRLANKFSVIDAPQEHKIHAAEVPRGGGLAFSISWLGVALLLLLPSASSPDVPPLLALIVGAAIAVAAGFTDDLRSISPAVKLLALTVAAVFFVTISGIWETFPPVVSIVSILWIVGLANAFNLIDGLDGLAAGLAAIGAAGLAAWGALSDQSVVFDPAFVLLAVCLGFLPFNRHPARIFMGDSGSLFLGFSLAALTLLAASGAGSIGAGTAPFLCVIIPVYDTALTIIRRMINKESLFMADKEHFYNLLMDRGYSHTGSVGFCLALALGAVVLGLTLTIFQTGGAAAIAAVLAIMIVLASITKRYRLLSGA